MAKRIDLRAYQESIAGKLAAAQAGDTAPALLGFEAGGCRWLVDLPAAGEVLPLPVLTPVPLTHAWFAGLASVHGELRSVVDFSVFCGGTPTPSAAARLLCIGTRFNNPAALLVERVHGLRRADTLRPSEAEPANLSHPWRGMSFTDIEGGHWTRLEVGRLLTAPDFLDAALPGIAQP